MAVAAVLLAAGPVSGQEPSRGDGLLRLLLMARESLAAAPAPPGPPVAGLRADGVGGRAVGLLEAALVRGPEGIRVRTLVRVGPGGERALLAAGAELGARVGDVVTARVPLESVEPLLADPSIRAMEAAITLTPLGALPAGAGVAVNDSALLDAGFGPLRRRAGTRWEGLAGAGVIVGVYDSGLDLTHDDFLDGTGATRVLFAWDQTEEGAGPGTVGGQVFGYGTECTAAVIDAGGCPMVDRIGHGTHVAGTLAGDGSATGRGQPAWRYPGGAPAADLIVVKGGDGVFTPDRLVDGVAYIFARAEALGRPAVVNLSLSSQQGPHDGSTLLEQALDGLSGPGRIVVSGAGNAGDHRNAEPIVPNGPQHARGRAGGPIHGLRIPPYAPEEGPANDVVLFELWYDGADSLTLRLRSPRGDVVSAATGDSASLTGAGGAVAIMNAVDGPAPGNGDHGALIGFLDLAADAPPDTGRWELEVEPVAIHGSGEYHLWMVGSTLAAARPPWLDGGAENRYLVGVPASADRVLAAGAHVTRHTWPGVDGEAVVFPIQETLGDIAYFSSPGPRRDGVSKPDLTAPGKMLISSLSKDATLWDGLPWLVEADSAHVALLGTSMASPQLAATVALLLQLEPELTPEAARDATRLSAAVDEFVPAQLPHPSWGAGKLDALAAVERLRPDGLAGAGEPVNLSANPVRGDALVINYPEPPRSIAVYTLIAERVRSFGPSEIGPLNTIWPLDTDDGGAVANGAYVLVVELEDRRVVRKLFVARP